MKLSGIFKEAFSPKALKSSLHAMGGGAAAGFGYRFVIGNVDQVADAWWKRALVAGVLGTLGASALTKAVKGEAGTRAKWGAMGAMGDVVAQEVYGAVKSYAGMSGLFGLGRTSVLTPGYPERPLLAGTVAQPFEQAGTGLGGRVVPLSAYAG